MSRDAITPPGVAHFPEERKKEWNYIRLFYPHKLRCPWEEASEEVKRGQERALRDNPSTWTESEAGNEFSPPALDGDQTGNILKNSFQ